MRRVRQESAEFYEVTALEVARALGIYVLDGDDVLISNRHGDNYKLVVRHHENEDVELEAPVCDPFSHVDGYDDALDAALKLAPFAPGSFLPPPPEIQELVREIAENGTVSLQPYEEASD